MFRQVVVILVPGSRKCQGTMLVKNRNQFSAVLCERVQVEQLIKVLAREGTAWE